jgi:hypothetical protein
MRGDINLTSSERGGRLRGAMLSLGLALMMVIVFAEARVAAIWWITLAAPLFVASLQLVQAYTGVCVFHAARGTRTCPAGGTEPILDPRKRTCVQARGRAVLAIATGMATSATALVVALAYVR